MVSVVLPTFNRAAFLPRALNSVGRQSYKDWELIVVDDHSTDSSAAVVEEWRKSGPWGSRLKWISLDQNVGVAAARNYGAKSAQGEWLAFLDSDDEWLSDKLERQLSLSEGFRLVHGEENWWRNGQAVKIPSHLQKGGGRIFSQCVEQCCISASATLMERSLFEELGGFGPDFTVCEDYDLWLRVCSRHSVAFSTQPVVNKFAGHSDQLSRAYPAMDFFRVKALVPFLQDPNIHESERQKVQATILKKCEILLKGYRKHQNFKNYEVVKAWELSARTQCQSAHSAAERRPRSESNFTL